MTRERQYNPVLHKRLSALIAGADYESVLSYVNSLNHSQFRTAGYILSARLLPEVSETEYWSLLQVFCRHHAKAFLTTFLKALPARMSDGSFHISHEGCVSLCHYWNEGGCEIDKRKFFVFVLPLLQSPDEADTLLRLLKMDNPEYLLDLLLRCPMTDLVAYVLFQTLRRLEYSRPLLYRCCVYLMKRGDSLSFNLVSFFKSYFDLTDLKGTFSLRVSSYQLNYLENSYAHFVSMLHSM